MIQIFLHHFRFDNIRLVTFDLLVTYIRMGGTGLLAARNVEKGGEGEDNINKYSNLHKCQQSFVSSCHQFLNKRSEPVSCAS
jgi:hypothetical protein